MHKLVWNDFNFSFKMIIDQILQSLPNDETQLYAANYLKDSFYDFFGTCVDDTFKGIGLILCSLRNPSV